MLKGKLDTSTKYNGSSACVVDLNINENGRNENNFI